MSSSRKDYVAVAAAIKDAQGVAFTREGQGSAAAYIAERVADHFAADNPSFDRDRFLKACGVAS